MKHIVQFSGGKDSTCMLLMMLERGMQVDEIIFCDTGMEFPQMYEHIEKVREYIKPYGKDITILKAENSFEHYMFHQKKSRGTRMDILGYGWSTMQNRWCTSKLKVDVTKKYLRGKDVVMFVGIAYDEPKRHQNVSENVRHPLFEWGITEKQALDYCYSHGFTWGGLYDKFRRVSCWCCPLQPISELRVLYHEFPALWQKLKEMDNKSIAQFKGTSIPQKFKETYSVQELEDRFKREDNGKRIAISLWDE